MGIKSLKTKLLAIFLLVGIVPLIILGLLVINSMKNDLQKEVSSKVLLLAEAKEGQVFAYLDSVESRAIDFSSDGFIRDSLREIANTGSAQAVEGLNRHLIVNKKSLDETIIGILVMDMNGKVVASTDNKEIGIDESADEYIIEGRKRIFTTELRKHEHFGLANFIVATAPLTDKYTGEPLGVIAIFFDTGKMQDILSGQFQMEKGAISGIQGQSEGLETYVVNREEIMFIHPYKIGEHGHFAGMKIDTLPVQKCLENNEEISDIYENYNGREVIGASMCFPDRKWVVLVEVDVEKAFAPINKLSFELSLITVLFTLFVIFLALMFSYHVSAPIKKLTKDIDEITKGNLDIHLKRSSISEVQSLTDSLNRILASLKLAVLKVGIRKEELNIGEAIKAKEKAEREAAKRAKQLEKFAKLAVGREMRMIELKKRIAELKGKHFKRKSAKDMERIIKKYRQR